VYAVCATPLQWTFQTVKPVTFLTVKKTSFSRYKTTRFYKDFFSQCERGKQIRISKCYINKPITIFTLKINAKLKKFLWFFYINLLIDNILGFLTICCPTGNADTIGSVFLLQKVILSKIIFRQYCRWPSPSETAGSNLHVVRTRQIQWIRHKNISING